MTEFSSERLTEAQLDTSLAHILEANGPAAHRILLAAGVEPGMAVHRVARQTRHLGAAGTIDLDVTLRSSGRLLVENKIDAPWSVTAVGVAQPERYRRTAETLRAAGTAVRTVLIAPEGYLAASRHAATFDAAVSYETACEGLEGPEADLIRAAIAQAAAPYEPMPDDPTIAFFARWRALATETFPALVLKASPNANGVRPSASRTLYFDVPRMLGDLPRVPRPRASIQARDSGAPHASAKLMIGGWGAMWGTAPAPSSLAAIGAYMRSAGGSLGLVVDTPTLDCRAPFDPQRDAVMEGLAAMDRLRDWWARDGTSLAAWRHAAEAAT
ncbi:MAG: hypothetical protein WBA25_10425 [Jannaschia sp.]